VQTGDVGRGGFFVLFEFIRFELERIRPPALSVVSQFRQGRFIGGVPLRLKDLERTKLLFGVLRGNPTRDRGLVELQRPSEIGLPNLGIAVVKQTGRRRMWRSSKASPTATLYGFTEFLRLAFREQPIGVKIVTPHTWTGSTRSMSSSSLIGAATPFANGWDVHQSGIGRSWFGCRRKIPRPSIWKGPRTS
jgi:hypothetical protein